MSRTFILTADHNQQIFSDVTLKGSKKTYEFDFSPWADDNHDVTSVTWTVKSGNVAISGQALTDNVASALFTFSDEGNSLVEIKATTSAEVFVALLNVRAKDPELQSADYGLCS